MAECGKNGHMSASRRERILRTFGQRLRAARLRKGFKSAEAFANHIGMNPHSYRKYERDPRNTNHAEPDFYTLVRLCEHLEVTPNDLLPEAADLPFQQHASKAS
jgi:transcriptional regulator with XRE-family HTH domain